MLFQLLHHRIIPERNFGTALNTGVVAPLDSMRRNNTVKKKQKAQNKNAKAHLLR